MTEQEAIEELKLLHGFGKEANEALGMAISALEEIQQYRVLGTVEQLKDMKENYAEALSDWRQYRKIGTVQELREAREKQAPKKLKIGNDNGNPRKCCARCKCFVLPASRYCSKCGQAIDRLGK